MFQPNDLFSHLSENLQVMIINFLKISLREFSRQKFFAITNVVGLSLGLVCCLAVFILIKYDLSFDKFHPDVDRIYRLSGERTESTGDIVGALLPPPAIDAIRAEISDIEASTAYFSRKSVVTIPGNAGTVAQFETDENTVILTEASYFDLFKYTWLAGAPAALNEPLKVILSQKSAVRYFGSVRPDQLLGKEIMYDSMIVTVAGVIEDWTKNTDITFTDFVSLASLSSSPWRKDIRLDAWIGEGGFSIFIRSKEGVDKKRLEEDFAGFVINHQMAESSVRYRVLLQPLTQLLFTSDYNQTTITDPDSFRKAHVPSLRAMALAVFFIWITAVLNFINLATARASYRSREVGVRRIFGGSRASLVFQFLMETFLITVVAVTVAVVTVNPCLKLFADFVPQQAVLDEVDFSTILFVVIITLATTLLAGLYPSFLLSSKSVIDNLKGNPLKRSGRWSLRKSLVAIQFIVSMVFIVGAIFVERQIRYSMNDPAIPLNQIVSVWCGGNDKIDYVVENFRKINGVRSVAEQMLSPIGFGRMIQTVKVDEIEEAVSIKSAGPELLDVMELKLLKGRNLSTTRQAREFLVNETYAKIIGSGNPEEAVGRVAYLEGRDYRIVGVFNDFHEFSFHEAIGPMAIGNLPLKLSALVRIDPARSEYIFREMETVWNKAYPDVPFQYTFLSDDVATFYDNDRNAGYLVRIVMSLVIGISCIGVLGLMMFTVTIRMKEISIRKVMGASVKSIVGLLSRDLVVLGGASLLLSWPISWYLVDQWLTNFAYRINMDWWVFVGSALALILISLLCSAFVIVKGSRANPALALKSE
jgi:putative ABC transport system permease protein